MNVFANVLINPKELPSLPLEEYRALPKCSGIYFAIDISGCVQYIGRSVNIRSRWLTHHKQPELEAIGDIRIAWLELSDTGLLSQVEEALIAWFDPPLNRELANFKFTDRNDRKAVQKSKVKVKCRLQDLLEAQELTRSALAQETGLTSAAIRGLCENTAKRYDADTLAVLCDFFGCDMGELFEVVSKDGEEAA